MNDLNPSLCRQFVIWFDLDDTLWDFTANSHEALAEVYSHFRLNRWWPDVDAWRDDYHIFNAELWEEYAKGTITSDYLRFQRFFRTLVHAGINQEAASAMSPEADNFYLDTLSHKTRVVDYAIDTLRWLVGKGFRIGILSNGFNDIQANKLKYGRLDEYIDYVVLSDAVGYNKPNPRIYREAERIAECDASHCVMIGDNFKTDIAGAIEANWPLALWLNNKGIMPNDTLNTSFHLSIHQNEFTTDYRKETEIIEISSLKEVKVLITNFLSFL
ncbi:MAG: HAD-IA family hydrolase [Muribaculaceae bacterium]|nr:HAD-IA family hydrolase [Muribaculaceae bacterium]